MKRTITAFYRTRAEAQKACDALKAASLGADVEIVDQTAANGHPKHEDFASWLSGLFGGHEDRHAYEEGLRRGHFLLTAKVDELQETRAAEILDAANPLDLQEAQRTWRADGWKAPAAAPVAATPAGTPAETGDQPVRIVGVMVRSYVLEPTR